MTEVLFYHLERASLESVLPGLLEKTLERGWRAMVRTSDAARAEAIDELLWTYRDDSFLPHGLGNDSDGQPVWIVAGDASPEGRDALFLVDGAEAAPTEIAALERCIMIFNGADDEAVAQARKFWKAAAADGHAVTYWRQSDKGRWEKQG